MRRAGPVVLGTGLAEEAPLAAGPDSSLRTLTSGLSGVVTG
jgi:hypothetical protein